MVRLPQGCGAGDGDGGVGAGGGVGGMGGVGGVGVGGVGSSGVAFRPWPTNLCKRVLRPSRSYRYRRQESVSFLSFGKLDQSLIFQYLVQEPINSICFCKYFVLVISRFFHHERARGGWL